LEHASAASRLRLGAQHGGWQAAAPTKHESSFILVKKKKKKKKNGVSVPCCTLR
jgi:hypothetical protein